MGLQSRHSQELSKTGKSRSEKKGREYGAERKTGGKDSGLFISVIPQGENPQLDRPPGRDTQSSENTHHCLSLSAPAIGVVGGGGASPSTGPSRQAGSQPAPWGQGAESTEVRRLHDYPWLLPALGQMGPAEGPEGPEPSPGAPLLPLSVLEALGSSLWGPLCPRSWVPSVLVSKSHTGGGGLPSPEGYCHSSGDRKCQLRCLQGCASSQGSREHVLHLFRGLLAASDPGLAGAPPQPACSF